MVKDFKKETLKELGIYELRELARLVGVPSPTTKKREELEDEIIIYSKRQTAIEPVLQNKKGRPPKSIKKVENVLDVFVPKEFAEIVINRRVDNELSNYLKFCKNNQYDVIKAIVGYVRKTLSGEYYARDNIDSSVVAAIPVKLIGKHNLVEGDKIQGQIAKAQDEKFFHVTEIYQINEKRSDPQRVYKEVTDVVLPFNKIKGFSSAEEGGRVVFVSETYKDSVEKLKEICSKIDKNYHFIILAPNITTYHKLLIQHEMKGEFIYTIVEDHPSLVYDAVTNCINHANVLLADNKKIIIVAFDLFRIKRGIEEHLALETNKISFQEELESSRIILKLLNTSKATEGGSISIFATCMAHETEENFFKDVVKKNTDTILGL